MRRMPWRRACVWLVAVVMVSAALAVMPVRAVWAAPVAWQELPASAQGRQWWDSGSLRLSRQGRLTVLSRFQPAPAPDPASAAKDSADASTPPLAGQDPGARPVRPALGRLYVMELDCDQALYRDVSVNGLPRWGSQWQPAGPDDLVRHLLDEVCAAGAPLLAQKTPEPTQSPRPPSKAQEASHA